MRPRGPHTEAQGERQCKARRAELAERGEPEVVRSEGGRHHDQRLAPHACGRERQRSSRPGALSGQDDVCQRAEAGRGEGERGLTQGARDCGGDTREQPEGHCDRQSGQGRYVGPDDDWPETNLDRHRQHRSGSRDHGTSEGAAATGALRPTSVERGGGA